MGKKTESQIEKEILVYLNSNGCFAWKNHTTGIFDEQAGSYRRSSPFAISGVSDIIGLFKGQVFFMEVKDERGRQSDKQKLFESSVTRHGGKYVLVRSVGDADEFLKSIKG